MEDRLSSVSSHPIPHASAAAQLEPEVAPNIMAPRNVPKCSG